jgi:hypothetical protein
MNSAGGYSRDWLLAVAVCSLGTVTAVLMARDKRVLLVIGGALIQGLVGAVVRKRQGGTDSVARALVRLVVLSPILGMPVLYLVFRQNLVWPVVAAWLTWTLGYALFSLKSGLAAR